MNEQGRIVENGATGPQAVPARRRRWLAGGLSVLIILLVLFVSIRGRFTRKGLDRRNAAAAAGTDNAHAGNPSPRRAVPFGRLCG